MENSLNQFYELNKRLNSIELKELINQIEQIDEQIKSSQNFLLQEIQRLKQDFDKYTFKVNYANDLRTIDQNTLKTFQNKFQDLTQVFRNLEEKELNTWQLVQNFRVNTSRLWHMFETATGNTITQELIYEDFEKLIHQSQFEKNEHIKNLSLLEKEHGDLLLKFKEIQINLEEFRTKILDLTKNLHQTKSRIDNQQKLNNHLHEQTSNKVHQLNLNTNNLQIFIKNYQSMLNEIHHFEKILFHNQTEIEIYNKSTLISKMNYEKYKQELILNMIKRANYENRMKNFEKIIQQQNDNFKELENQQGKILQYRKQLHQQISVLENKKTQILNQQQELLNKIKQMREKNGLLDKEMLYSKNLIRKNDYNCEKLIKDQNKQGNITKHLQKTIETNERQLENTKHQINQLTEQTTQQDFLINSKETQIETHTKDLKNLQNSSLKTHEEIEHQHKKINESKIKVKFLTQKLHTFDTDERSLIKQISQYQKQILQNKTKQNQLKFNLKENQTKINQYKTMTAKLIISSKENDQILTKNHLLIKHFNHRIDQSKENIEKSNQNYKYSEETYRNLKGIFHETENTNKQLKQQYVDLTFLIQLLGQRQTLFNNQLKTSYEKLKYLIKQHQDKVNIIEQSKSDFTILQKYYLQLKSYNHQLHQSLSLKSQEEYPYLHSESLSNQSIKFKTNSNTIHYWFALMINSPEKFQQISKLFLIKKKLVKKFNELVYLRKVFYEKKILYRYVNQIYQRRQKLIDKINTYDQ